MNLDTPWFFLAHKLYGIVISCMPSRRAMSDSGGGLFDGHISEG